MISAVFGTMTNRRWGAQVVSAAVAACVASVATGCVGPTEEDSASGLELDSRPGQGTAGSDSRTVGLSAAGAAGTAASSGVVPDTGGRAVRPGSLGEAGASSSDEAAPSSNGGAAAPTSRGGAPAMGGRASVGKVPGEAGSGGDGLGYGGMAGDGFGRAGATGEGPIQDAVIEVDWTLPGATAGSVVALALTESGVEVERRVIGESPEQYVRTLPETASVGIAVFGPRGRLERTVLSSAACPVLAVSTRAPLRVPADYETIQEAIDGAEPGDTVLVAPGTYREAVTLRTGVTLRGEDPRTTIWDGAGEGRTLVDYSGAREVTIRGFTFRNVGLANGCANPEDVFLCAGGWYAAAVYADGHGMQDAWPCRTATAFIVDNVFEGNTIGVMTYFLSQAVLANNLFIGNDHAVVANHHGDTANLVLNNVFFENDRAVSLQASYSHLHDNIFVHGSALVREFVQTGQVGCNLFHEATVVGETVETAEPGFVDATAGNFRLAPGSPAIDAGCFAEELTDRDGSPADLGLFGGPFAAE